MDKREINTNLSFKRTSSENQPRRNEGHEERPETYFVLFGSSWFILIVSGRRTLRHVRLLRKSTTKKRRTRRKARNSLRVLRVFVVDFHSFRASHAATCTTPRKINHEETKG